MTTIICIVLFLSTLSLRRATSFSLSAPPAHDNFYPRSPCGERQRPSWACRICRNFYPRSPCGERPEPDPCIAGPAAISIHALLAESDLLTSVLISSADWISIHALLAESDFGALCGAAGVADFYPRSPCGERRKATNAAGPNNQISIHALLAESDRVTRALHPASIYFYPRSPCGERPAPQLHAPYSFYFYPRSPCGERLSAQRGYEGEYAISIHALLAESDESQQPSGRPTTYFYPRSPCGERQCSPGFCRMTAEFLSTLSLRRATLISMINRPDGQEFLSTLSLRRATNGHPDTHQRGAISIHALLAESDTIMDNVILVPGQFLSTLSLRRATSMCIASNFKYPFLSTLSLRRATIAAELSIAR